MKETHTTHTVSKGKSPTREEFILIFSIHFKEQVATMNDLARSVVGRLQQDNVNGDESVDNDMIVIRQDGTRHLGCDESSGWVWYAARALHQFLVNKCTDMNGLSILELGAGTGWLALQLACRGAKVTATDRSGALPLLFRNVMSNQERLAKLYHKELDIDVQCLEWGENCESTHKVLGNWDVIVGSDILYLEEGFAGLLETFFQHECKWFVIAWEERKPAVETKFLQMARDFGLDLEINSAGMNPTTLNPIWIVSMTYKKS